VIRFEIGVADLAASRFAFSPLDETVMAIRLLAEPGKSAVNAPWVQWAQAELARRPQPLGRVWPLLINVLPYYPEFLIPAPAVRCPAFDTELDRLRATPAEAVRASLGRVFGGVTWPASAVELAACPAPSLAEIAAELAGFHDRLIAPHWERMRAVLDADVAYRGRLLADGGARALLHDLHSDLHWDEGVLTISEPDPRFHDVVLGPDGVVIMPSVFGWPDVSVRKQTSTQTTLHYPARGAATVWYADGGTAGTGGTAPDPGAAATAELLGTVRARLLSALRSPATTTALARGFGVTPGAVSQHLSVLHRAGLADRTRTGRTVLYQATDLGLALLDPPRPVPSRHWPSAVAG
jgi:DNA-binding transcriptional ArsR family regulator